MHLTAPSFLHCLRDSCLKTVHGPKDRSPLNGVPVRRPLWNRARDALGVTPVHQLHLPSVKTTFRDERPVGRQRTFVPGYRTPIHPITGWPSLLPTSHARTPIGSPYGSLSLTGRVRGFQVPLVECVGVGACCRPGGHGPRYSLQQGNIPPPLPFWLEPINLFGSFRLTTVTQIHIRSPCRLSNPLPGRGFQEGAPLAISSPHVFDMLWRIVPAALHSGR